MEFTHLHVHTEYSLLDGSSKIKELIKRTKELGMDSIAITDHGVMYGAIEFYKEAVANGIKPIIGCEAYVASGSRLDKDPSKDNFYYHLVLLAKDNNGYRNLAKLVSIGFTEGFYYKPRIDIETLEKYHEGIIALSACLAGPISKTILNVSYEKAKEMALKYNEIFGDGNFYLEMQDHGISEQKTVNQQIMRINKETGIPLVCTNDLHYIKHDDASAHDILICIQTGKTVNDENRMKYEGSEFYLKSPEEMYNLFPYAHEALENTNKIADKCNVTFEFNKYKLPKFDVPENKNAFDFLNELCFKGLKRRYKNITKELKNRLQYELDLINNMGFVDYFLIVWDFIKYAKDNNISVGPGRGSAAGSIAAYCLYITDIDPIRFGLIFERFLNPERITMPDIDIDFCYERRQEVIDYVVRKYGADHVAQIITFGTMAARNAIRDVGRALAMPYAEVDRIAKMIPMELKITIEKALKLNPELSLEYKNNESVKYLIDMSMKLEGLPRHASTHAAGVVICDRPVVDYVPLNSNDGVITTQYTMTTLEELGLLKMDFLGLRTLTVIKNAFNEIKRNYGIDIEQKDIDYDDKNVFELIASGNSEGVFQLESPGMKQFMKELKPKNIEDIIAGISLYRPGPMEFIPKYVNGKNSGKNIKYTHKALEPILKNTYGCIVYQEQVMQIVRDLAGYSLGRSDMVRRVMSKKKADIMEKERKNFIYGLDEENVPGCIKNGIDKEAAEKIFDEMADFAKYAFNKSHAAAYAVVAYQTAWLKTYYPIEFMAALLTSVIDFPNKVTEYIYACRKMNIELLPPDINEGYGHFSVKDKKIRFSLSAIKTVGKAIIDLLVENRTKNGPYISMSQFIERVGLKFNSRAIENLIKAGAFDSLGGKRSQYLAVYKNLYNDIGQKKKKNFEGQINLFQLEDNKERAFDDHLPNIKEFDTKYLLSLEKEVIGIYISGHPLSEYQHVLKKYISNTSLDFTSEQNEDFQNSNKKVYDGQKVIIGGIISQITVKYTKNNKTMAFLGLEDMYGTIEIILFPNIYASFSSILQKETVILVSGHASVSEDQPSKVICETIQRYDELSPVKRTLWLKISKDSNIIPNDIIKYISSKKGNTPVIIYNEAKKQKLTLKSENYANIDEDLIDGLKKLLGEKCVVLKEDK